jgi:hypothetical protein
MSQRHKMEHLLFSLQLSLPSIQYMENCRLVRSGTKEFDNHCLPTTISGEMEELLNVTRRDNFLVYLQCWELCEAYGLPLTEEILMRGRGLLQGRALAIVELVLILATLSMYLAKPLWPLVGTLGRKRKKGKQPGC